MHGLISDSEDVNSVQSWQSDDEPPSKDVGNLQPLALDAENRRSVRAVKRIEKLGETFAPPGRTDDLEVFVSYSPNGAYVFEGVWLDLEAKDELIAHCVRFMETSETATILTQTDKSTSRIHNYIPGY